MKNNIYIIFIFLSSAFWGCKESNDKNVILNSNKPRIYKGILNWGNMHQNDTLIVQLYDNLETKISIISSDSGGLFKSSGKVKLIDSSNYIFDCKEALEIGCMEPLPFQFGTFAIIFDSGSYKLLKGDTIKISSKLNSINTFFKINSSLLVIKLDTSKIGSNTEEINIIFPIPNTFETDYRLISIPHNKKKWGADISVMSNRKDWGENFKITKKAKTLFVAGLHNSVDILELKLVE